MPACRYSPKWLRTGLGLTDDGFVGGSLIEPHLKALALVFELFGWFHDNQFSWFALAHKCLPPPHSSFHLSVFIHTLLLSMEVLGIQHSCSWHLKTNATDYLRDWHFCTKESFCFMLCLLCRDVLHSFSVFVVWGMCVAVIQSDFCNCIKGLTEFFF